MSTAERTASVGEEKGPGQRSRADVCVIREREGERESAICTAEWQCRSSRCFLCMEVMEVGLDGCRSPAASPNNSA